MQLWDQRRGLSVDENGEALPQMFVEAHREFVVPPEGFLFDVLLEGNFIPAMATLIRRECFTQVGTYDEDLCFEDWDMWMRISRRFRFAYDKIPAAKYRILSSSVVRTMSEAIWRSIMLLRMKYFRRGGGYNLDAGSSALMAKGELGLLQYDRMVRRRATKEVAKRSAREKRGFGLGWDCVAFISAWFAHTSAMENYAVKTQLLR